MTLTDFLAQPDETGRRRRRNEFAAAIGVTPSMVTEYCAGTAWPGRDVMEKIVRETGGLVTPNDFLSEGAAA